MLTLSAPSAPVEPFLHHLAAEEQFLAAAIEKGQELYAALRRGAVPEAHGLGAEQERIAAGLRAASAARLEATGALAASLELAPERATLAALAERLPEPQAETIRAARERLAALAAELDRIQTRNANLLGHLRSFFRDVLADCGVDDTPTRYGPSGQWLPPASNQPLLRRGTIT
ncbi:flagellar export chaperone FlgN [Gemmata sp. JC717]|uniref:Flagellar export chaperone FlgN n=1 Tax=Gemmata algarum TaxID=2975278 RepID=A0ABU5ERA8_9BACT|nr:flagellar export chaperone FlgN [Gemmata algarum]MDY3556838.1 flagellar export chaperone FlgN [Gemmata algarum]MDY3557872.1 flagellar export chaperone FlgN [Gemmata algarum]